jgi:hypothetical protein
MYRAPGHKSWLLRHAILEMARARVYGILAGQ